METSIRYIQIPNSGVKPSLVFRGTKTAHCIINDGFIRVLELPLKSIDGTSVVKHKGSPYPVRLFVEGIRGVGQRVGLTKRAVYLLDRAIDNPTRDDFEELPPDELDDPAVAGIHYAEPSNEGSEPAAVGSAPHKPKRKATKATKATKPARNPDPTPKSANSEPASRGTVVAAIAAELKIEGTKLRKLLRSEGLSAPYDDPGKIRSILKKLGVCK